MCRSRLVLLLLVACPTTAALALCATAQAAVTNLEITVGSEPVESIATQLGMGVEGNAKEDVLWLSVHAAGGEKCAENPSADQGETVIEEYVGSEASPLTTSRNYTFEAAGSYELCAWVTAGYSEDALAHADRAVSVRQPHLSLSISAPASVTTEQVFQISTTAQAETARDVWEYLSPNTGDACAANASAAEQTADTDTVLYAWDVDGGPFAEAKNESLSEAGSYLICAYFEYPGRESPPELTASATLAVTAPPPPCVVPTLNERTGLASAETALRAAGCTVGHVSHAASRSVPRGDVIALDPASGEKLAPGAAVALTVSAGRPCVVPLIRRSSSVGHAEHQLAAADCRAQVSYTHSRLVRRGRVLRVLARVHSRLAPRAKVELVVSSGRRR